MPAQRVCVPREHLPDTVYAVGGLGPVDVGVRGGSGGRRCPGLEEGARLFGSRCRCGATPSAFFGAFLGCGRDFPLRDERVR